MIDTQKHVTIVEVGPRDGLQNETGAIDTDTKINLVNGLANAGLKVIETGSFVNPKWVPQMQDSALVFAGIDRREDVRYTALTPNIKGFENAIAANADEVAVFGAASEAFSQKNINCSIAESLERFEQLMQEAKHRAIPVRGYVSCVLGCPYQGDVTPEAVMDVSLQLLEMGCYEVSLGDTIGTGNAGSMTELLSVLLKEIPPEKLAVHCHDTYGQALANIYVALTHGIRTIDSSVAGLGGCPYAQGASGNVATEDVVYMLNGLGFNTGIDLPVLIETGQTISDALQRRNGSRTATALAKKTPANV